MTSIPSSSAPLQKRSSPVEWLQKNLFSSVFDSVLTVIIAALMIWVAVGLISWASTTAQWSVIPANLPLYFVGRFPSEQYWRLWVILGLLFGLSGLSWGVLARNATTLFGRTTLITLAVLTIICLAIPTAIVNRLLLVVFLIGLAGLAWVGRQLANQVPAMGQITSVAWGLMFLVTLWFLSGGLGLAEVSTNLWGGLLLTLLMSVVSTVLSFPFGVILALGRRSSLPVIRWLATIYIEVIRGVPLISILFIGQIMIPLFLPEGMRPDRVLRAIVGLTLFTAAYLAENIRGGLQSIPRGQTEAAQSLGLNTPLTLAMIILPQAIKVSIPAIVGQFISLFQDTTLVSIVGLLELLGISRSILANPDFLGRYSEVYLFIGVLYWAFCYAMSVGSRKIEASLKTTN